MNSMTSCVQSRKPLAFQNISLMVPLAAVAFANFLRARLACEDVRLLQPCANLQLARVHLPLVQSRHCSLLWLNLQVLPYLHWPVLWY